MTAALVAALMRQSPTAFEQLIQGPDFTEQGQHAREVADWALPLEETLLRWEAVATARTRLHRARLCLREALTEYCVERRQTSA
jgi:hypothetical protein